MGEDSAPRSPGAADRRVLKFEAAGWKIADRERTLYSDAPTISNLATCEPGTAAPRQLHASVVVIDAGA